MTDTTTTVSSDQELYTNLMTLCADSSNLFYSIDAVTPMQEKVRIFNYHYASYSDWLKVDALACRGIMFTVDSTGAMIALISRPMDKFFNLNENPFTTGLDLSGGVFASTKQDGSLISSYLSKGYLYLKSKASLYSDQAVAAMQLLNTPAYSDLRTKINDFEINGYTVNLEYCSPTNRIVLSYQEPELVLLNVRNRKTGEYIVYSDLYADAVVRKYLTEAAEISKVDEWLTTVKAATDVEGFVCQTDTGLFFKIKSDWYCNIHKVKNSVTNNEALYTTIVAGGGDDLIALFKGDDYATNKILAFEKTYLSFLSNAITTLQTIFEQVRSYDRKTYAITSMQELNKTKYPWLFGVIMKYYSTNLISDTLVPNIASAFIKNYSAFIPVGYENVLTSNEDDTDS